MWGWKAVERTIEPSVTLEQARGILEAAGFTQTVANPAHAIFKRAGTQLSTSGKDFSVEAAVAKSEGGLFLQIRYDTFVLFDTGDLEKLAADLASQLSP